MSLPMLRKYMLHRKRLEGMSWPRQFRYAANVLLGESFRRRGIGRFGPRMIEITLTHRCQCRCVHCYDEAWSCASETDELSTQEVASVLRQAFELGFIEVNFTGGEPLVRKDIVDLVKTARTVGLVPKISTNGMLLTESLVAELKAAGLAWAAVSIGSAEREVHDRLRRYEGCFDLAVQGIRRLVDHDVPASITACAMRETIQNGDLGKVVQMGHELGVETVRILFPVPIGGFHNAPNETLNLEERERVRELLDDPIVTLESPKEKTRCTAAVTKLNVLPDGEVTPCVFVPRSYGNIRDVPLRDIWAKLAEFDKMWKHSGQCPFCDDEFRERLLSPPSTSQPV